MKYKLIFKITGMALILEAAGMLASMLIGSMYNESPIPFIVPILLILCIAIPATLQKNNNLRFGIREGMVCGAIIWLLMSLFGAIPFRICGQGEFSSFVNCFFESCSGVTTTGSTILTDIESMPRGILFWRSFTHWLGGMGILILALAVFPSMGEKTHHLMNAESTGPVSDKVVSKVTGNAKILYLIYVCLTIAEAIILCFAGLPMYDAVVTAFSNAGTGGFAVLNDSIGGYNNLAVEIIITFFTFCFGINFGVFFLLFTGRLKKIFDNSELKMYVSYVLVSIFLITVNIYHIYGSVGAALRYASFQVVTISTTTGFMTADFMLWPTFSQAILLILMFFGACAGSTSGGLKSSRIIILFKSIGRGIYKKLHPNAVKSISFNGRYLSEDAVSGVHMYICVFFVLIVFGTLIISLDKYSITESLSAVITCLCNIGPGLNEIGPAGNFSGFSDISKTFLSILMIVGRLEIYPVLLLFSPATWKKM